MLVIAMADTHRRPGTARSRPPRRASGARRCSSGRRSAGFTLVEMMAVVSIMAIMLAFAVPGMRDLLEAQRLRSVTFDLVADLTLARNEALKRGAGVTVAPLGDGDWSGGWRVSLDADGSVLRERTPGGGDLTVSDAPAAIAYDRNGRLVGGDGVIRVELDSASLSHEGQKRCVSVDPLGRARSDVGGCA